MFRTRQTDIWAVTKVDPRTFTHLLVHDLCNRAGTRNGGYFNLRSTRYSTRFCLVPFFVWRFPPVQFRTRDRRLTRVPPATAATLFSSCAFVVYKYFT